MAAIANDRDVLLQAASPRVLPVPIPEAIKEQLRRLKINASATTVTEDGATTTPTSITLTAVKEGTLEGAVTWSATGATVTGSGDTVSVAGTSIADAGATVTTSVTQDGKTYSAQLNLTKTKVPKGLRIESSGMTFIGRSSPTNPATITLTAVRSGGLTGAVTWSVFAGSATLTPSGDTCTVTGSTVSGYSVTVKATVGAYSATIALTRLGELSAQEKVDLTSMVTGQLASGNVSGLGALALLNTVNLNTQTTGALNGATQVTNLGTLAYANAIAANQIGAGTLAAGVIYAGTVNASQVSAGSFSGKTFTGGSFTGAELRTTNNGGHVFASGNKLSLYDSGGTQQGYLSASGSLLQAGSAATALTVQGGGQGALTVIGMGSSPAVWLTGRLQWGNIIWSSPTGSATEFMRADGNWSIPATLQGQASAHQISFDWTGNNTLRIYVNGTNVASYNTTSKTWS